ncbi:MAG TPA: hypothetical protein VFJ80_07060 [Candidatus Limnocylindrales bacterium]|nr:hypothetical protein [Candidatus Limnocylindrales bacterium]
MSRSVRRSLCLLAVIAALVAPGTVAANHSWGGYHWARQANPFTLKLGENLGSVWDPILGTTSSDWSRSTVLDTTIVAGGAKPRNCRPTSGRVEVCNAAYGSTGWLGVAQIWITGGTHITQGTVKVNDTYFATSTYNTTAWRNLVMCQEVGHTLGLDHQDENFNNANLGTCMDYTNDPSTNQHPNQHDYDELQTIYAHLDSTTTIGQAALSTAAPGAASGAASGAWGRQVATSHGGAASTFVRETGRGQSVVTFVVWAR